MNSLFDDVPAIPDYTDIVKATNSAKFSKTIQQNSAKK